MKESKWNRAYIDVRSIVLSVLLLRFHKTPGYFPHLHVAMTRPALNSWSGLRRE